MRTIFIKLIKKYQENKKANHTPSCIFYPSCSDYALIALNKYNILKALVLIFKRIYRCDSTRNFGGEDFP